MNSRPQLCGHKAKDKCKFVAEMLKIFMKKLSVKNQRGGGQMTPLPPPLLPNDVS